MKITGEDLAKMANYLPGLKLFVKWTPTTIDDSIVRVLEIVAGDQQLLDALAEWLSWMPLFEGGKSAAEEPPLPGCLNGNRAELENWRTYIRAV